MTLASGEPATMTRDHGELREGDAVWIGAIRNGEARVTRFTLEGGTVEAREPNVPLDALAPR